MEIEFDPNKNQRNMKKRKLSFELVVKFEWDTSVIWQDNRHDYGETRFCALGYIGVRIYYLAFTLRSDRVRVISLRKVSKREVSKYAET